MSGPTGEHSQVQGATSAVKAGACSGAVGGDKEEEQDFVRGLDNRVVSEDVEVKGSKVECTEEQLKVCFTGSACACICVYVCV